MLLHFLVLKHAVSRLARSSASTLQLHYTLNAAQRAQQRPCQVDSGWAQPHLAPEQLPFPPSNPSPPGQGAHDDSGQQAQPSMHLVSHKFVLESNDVAETPRSIVAVQLLGPFSVRLGEAATFCWRLERVGSTGVVAEVASLVPYEAVADSDAWAPAAPRVSYVTLPSQAGSFVTVEAAWTAVSPGALPVPQLRLRDVAQKEVYDGASASIITCQA
ncbi:hypothetical protein COCSUDRAFT_52946 [Coccomyxa subellipsoidea C-169]|uniref:Uncharacterized protein n=1 Tax=Coccomyxa subellipsoidea (strain C-169) TaxID=574566 RepID=I0Z165_COCSC|nr:hypothetical protein COCSUDRAFT_52946 [Coccomyxa subellipsoidea C-169]EIE24384.1 hypothetical protein COCSUDRAFT_52946 [Coccomyxa subellipsoidea C-169]|eukprot:XP_005648928.1 hypothetical protein COCSUDRAFT_52946 [Coccomyxa subellipsoidea C-169]